MADLSELTKHLQSLEEKVRQLIAVRNILEAKLAEALQEKDELQTVVKKQVEEIKVLQKKLLDKSNHFHNQDKISKIVELTFADKDNPNGLKEKLDEYIREIDQCIALLSQ